MRGNPHSYQSIAFGDPGFWPSPCEECEEAEALEYDNETERELCVGCMDDLELAEQEATT